MLVWGPKITILNKVMILVNFSRQIWIPHRKISKNDHSLAASASLRVLFSPKKGKKCSIGAPKMRILNYVMILIHFSKKDLDSSPQNKLWWSFTCHFCFTMWLFYPKKAQIAVIESEIKIWVTPLAQIAFEHPGMRQICTFFAINSQSRHRWCFFNWQMGVTTCMGGGYSRDDFPKDNSWFVPPWPTKKCRKTRSDVILVTNLLSESSVGCFT